MTRRDGAALVIVLFITALVASFTLLALRATAARLRLAGDARWTAEARIVVDGALAELRVAHRGALDSLADSATLVFAPVQRTDGWSWRGAATRAGVIIRLTAMAERRAADGSLYAARRVSLLLVRRGADTVRVLDIRPRF